MTGGKNCGWIHAMPPVDRKNPIRAASSDSRYSVMEFMREFPDDEACLQWLWKTRHAVDEEGKRAFCPKCELDRPFHRVSGRPAWDCDYCGYHLHPTAGTIFHKSSTSLQLWFYAMFMVSQTRCGISAKQLEREIGVTYKTAWRMLNKIRNQLMDEEDDEPLSGEVEMDETWIGGYRRGSGNHWRDHKKMILGAVARGGEVRLEVREGPGQGSKASYRSFVATNVDGKTEMIFTDSARSWGDMNDFDTSHEKVDHSKEEWVRGIVHTNTIEGVWSLFKRGVVGTYHQLSAKHLPAYLDEMAFRFNNRDNAYLFRDTLLRMIAGETLPYAELTAGK